MKRSLYLLDVIAEGIRILQVKKKKTLFSCALYCRTSVKGGANIARVSPIPIKRTLLLGAWYLLGACSLPGTRYHLLIT